MNDSVRQPVYKFAGFRLDAQRRVLLGNDGYVIELTPRLLELLLYLVERPGRLLTKEELLEAVWPHAVVEEHNLNKAISALRRGLGEKPGEHRFIATQPGRGYRFVADVSVAAPPHIEAVPKRGILLPAPRRMAMVATMVIGGGVFGMVAATWNASTAPPRLGAVVSTSPLTTEPGRELEPAWAPDGARVAFSRNGSIYVTQLGASEPHRLTAPARAQDRGPAWDPAGTRVAFLREYEPTRHDLMVVDAISGAELVLAHDVRTRPLIEREAVPLFAWLPDGQRLLVTTRRTHPGDAEAHAFNVVDVATHAIDPFGLEADLFHYDTSPAFSRDGRRLAFVRYRTGQRLSELMVQELSADYRPIGLPQPVPGVPAGLPHSPSWSPDGTRLLFASNREIYEWHRGQDARVVTTTQLVPSGLSASWQDDRVLVVGSFRQTDLDLWSLPIDPLTREKTGEPVTRFASTFNERHMRFSHDGRKLAFVSARSGRGELWIAEGDELIRLTDHDATILSTPRWSPDDRYVAYRISAGGEPNVMYVVDVASGVKRRLGPGSPSFWLGDYLYYDELSTTDRGAATLLRMRMPDGEPERLFPGAVAVASTDGTRILYTKKERGIFSRTLAGNAVADDEVRLVDDYVILRGATAPVPGGFFYVGHTFPDELPSAIKFYDYATQTAKEVHAVPLDIDIGMAISPDGTELLYAAGSADPQADLMVIEIAELPPRAAE